MGIYFLADGKTLLGMFCIIVNIIGFVINSNALKQL